MTIICYRDGVMAADSLISSMEIRRGRVRKIVRTETGWLCGASGYCGEVVRFLEWSRTAIGAAEAKFSIDVEDGDFAAVAVSPAGEVEHFDHKGHRFYVEAPFYAIGAGREIAIGAMAHGASAEQAAQYAIDWAVSCGGPVHVERLSD